jgi:DNA-directed RNA polymerase specialized sigma24 family protein
MKTDPHPNEAPGLCGVSDEDLVRRFSASPADTEAGEELAVRCGPKLRRAIAQMVFVESSLCPLGQDRHAFAEDAFARANQYLLRGLRTFQFRGSFDGWLAILAKRAALDERRTLVGRQTGPRPVVESLEAMQEAGGALPADHPLFCSMYAAHPADLMRDREHREIVTKVLALHAQSSDRNAECAWAIRLRMWGDLPVPEIARRRGSSDRDVWRLLAENYAALQNLLVNEFGITNIRHV